MLRMLLVVATLGPLSANRPDTTQKSIDKRGTEPEVGDLSGYYICKGAETGGKNYSGVTVITKKNDVYLIQWVVGGSTFFGIGIRQGNTLAASWAMPGDKGVVRGVNLYKIEPGPRLSGRWASFPGPGYMQNETLSFLKPFEADD